MVDIRTLTERDVPALLPLVCGFYSLHREFLGGTGAPTGDESREIVEEMVLDPRSQIIIAVDGKGELVGFARWEEREGAFFGRELFVVPGHRSQGIGGRLQAEVEERVRQAGGDAFFISIVPHNQSMLAFAHKRGYDTLNTIELRKELAGEQPRRGRTDLFGIEFKII